MALRKSLKTIFGTQAKYWNIALIQHNFKDRVLIVKVVGYSDNTARLEDAQPMTAFDMAFSGDDFPEEITREQAYRLVKRAFELSDAEDV